MQNPAVSFSLAKSPPHKEKIDWLIEELTHLATQQGVTIEYNIEATKEVIDTYHPHAVIFATGGEAISPRISGSESESVVTVTPILTGEKSYSNKKIAVVGSGMTGLETAELLLEQGNTITVIEMVDKIALGAHPSDSMDVVKRLKQGNVRFFLGRRLDQIDDGMLAPEPERRRS